jgi:hypothetical protein
MPKAKIDDLPQFDPYALINKSQLRQGEKHALTIHVRGLERALEHKTNADISRLRRQSLELSLSEDGAALIAVIPGDTQEHVLSWPMERLDLALQCIVKILRERKGTASPVGTPGAPTQADLKAIEAAIRAGKVKKVGTVENLTLEDLDL